MAIGFIDSAIVGADGYITQLVETGRLSEQVAAMMSSQVVSDDR